MYALFFYLIGNIASNGDTKNTHKMGNNSLAGNQGIPKKAYGRYAESLFV